MSAILILGVDPGLNRCGWGLVLSEGSRLSHVAHGVIAPKQQQQLASRLHDVFEGLCAVIAQYQPHEAAVEETFVNSNARAALALGQARGVGACRSGASRTCGRRVRADDDQESRRRLRQRRQNPDRFHGAPFAADGR